MADAEPDQADHHEIAALTADIVSAYVGHHTLATTDLPALIAAVGQEIAGLGQAEVEPEEEKPVPAVPIKRSVREEQIICLICGKAQKMLKRHLSTRHELEPDAYRAMFGLMDDYPMVAPSYAAQRSDLAKKIGLGRRPAPKPMAKTAGVASPKAARPAAKRAKKASK